MLISFIAIAGLATSLPVSTYSSHLVRFPGSPAPSGDVRLGPQTDTAQRQHTDRIGADSNSLEFLVPKDAVAAMRLQDPGGLLAGPASASWAPILLDENLLTPFIGEWLNDEHQATTRSALGQAMASCDEVIAFYGGTSMTPKDDAPQEWMGLAMRGGPAMSDTLHRLLAGKVHAVLSDQSAHEVNIYLSDESLYITGSERFYLILGSDKKHGVELLKGMLSASQSATTPNFGSPFHEPGLPAERRSDDLEIVIRFDPLFREGIPLSDSDLIPIEEDLGRTLRSLTWAYLGGSVDSAGYWKMRGVMPYMENTLLGSLLGMPTALSKSALKPIPSDCKSALVFGLDLPKLIDWAETYFPVRYGISEAEVQEGYDEFHKDTGRHLRSEFLDLLGPHFYFLERQDPRPDNPEQTRVRRNTAMCLAAQFTDHTSLLKTMQAMLEGEEVEAEGASQGRGQLWNPRFIFSRVWASQGRSLISIGNSRFLAEALFLSDPSEPAAGNISDLPFIQSIPHLSGRFLLSARNDAKSDLALSELAGLVIGASGLSETSARRPLMKWGSLVAGHWDRKAGNWSVIQLAAQGSRLEAVMTTH